MFFSLYSLLVLQHTQVPEIVAAEPRDGPVSVSISSLCRSDGVMRTVNTEKLLKTIPIIQNQMDVLLDFNVRALDPLLTPSMSHFHLLGLQTDPVISQPACLPKVNANELTNGVINAAFMLLFKDAIRLFAAYNEGIINLLGKSSRLGWRHRCPSENGMEMEM